MVTVDWSSILDSVIALSIVLAPLELFILRNLVAFRSTFSTLKTNLDDWVTVLSTREGRASVISELGHGLLRALSEKAGSLKGVDARQQNAGLMELVRGGSPMALASLPGKIELPIIGKVTIGEALTIAQSLGAMMKGGGGLQGLLQAGGSTAGGAGYPR